MQFHERRNDMFSLIFKIMLSLVYFSQFVVEYRIKYGDGDDDGETMKPFPLNSFGVDS